MITSQITSQKALSLKQKFGDNLLPHKEKYTWFSLFISQFKNPLVILLLIVGILSFYFNELLDAALIGLVILFNIVTGFIQEFSAQKTLSALNKIVKTKTVVIRDNQRVEIETKDLVPGDIAFISSGDKIPADGKLIQGTNILVNEAILTGEEESVIKDIQNNNLVFMGSIVISGQGMIQVEKIGIATKMGTIGKSLTEIKEEDTPLQKKLTHLSKSLILIVTMICLVIFLIGMFRGGELWETIRMSIVLSIAAVPEGLPIAVTVILSIGMRKVLKKKGLVKKLLSIETLGSTSVICLDKTGTITEGKMQVVKTSFKNKKKFLFALTLLNDRKAAMEVAIWQFLKKNTKNPETIFNQFDRVEDEPFDGTKKYKCVINKIDGNNEAFLMGAPEIIMNFCQFDSTSKKLLVENIENWASAGLRILGVAVKSKGDLHIKKNFTWLGLIGIEDPVRKEAAKALEEVKNAGIKLKIVTGDYRLTAQQVAKKIGLEITADSVMDFEELNKISDQQLSQKIEKINLFSRVTPLQKLKIIELLQSKGEIVAMTGDGVNDAPALKKADIGIVVENGTDVAKEAADLVLLDSNFKTIVNACEEGRLILANIKKVIGYVLSNSFAEITLISGAMILGLPTPLTVAQILWIHLICDGPPDIMLAFEPKEKGIMFKTPKDISQEQIFSDKIKLLIVLVSLTIGISSLIIFHHYADINNNIPLARTIVFAILGTVSLVYIFSFKNLKSSILHGNNLLDNKYLLAGVLYGFFLVFLAIYTPILNKILGTVPLNFYHWFIIGMVTLTITLIVEIIKFLPDSIKSH